MPAVVRHFTRGWEGRGEVSGLAGQPAVADSLYLRGMTLSTTSMTSSSPACPPSRVLTVDLNAIRR